MLSQQATLGSAPLDLMEDAVHWLRRMPAGVHLGFLFGTVPFLLALLWFWSDMSRGAFADRRCGTSAGWVGVLYLWMKSWHAVYCAELRSRMAAEPSVPWSVRRWFAILVVQVGLQPWGLILFPLSFVPLLLPMPWTFALFRNIDVLADENQGRVGATFRAAFHEAKRWPGQNHGLVGLLLVAATVVLINVAIVLATLPSLVKMLTGLDSDFTLSTSAMIFNSTYLLAVGAVTYLVLAPLVLAIYTRRTFEGTALQTGADLRARLRQMTPDHVAPLSKFLLAFIVFMSWNEIAPPTHGAEISGVAAIKKDGPSPAVTTLDRAIQDVLERPDFTWRERRQLSPVNDLDLADDPGARWWQRLSRWFERQLKALGTTLEAPFQALGRQVSAFLKWLFGPAPPTPTPHEGPVQVDWLTGLKLLLYAASAAGVVVLIGYALRLWHRRQPKAIGLAKPALAPAIPDLTAENLSAAALPDESWLALARELAANGDFRLAVRAVYLGELAHLAQREFVRLATAKSNREYQRELNRRAQTLPQVRAAFAATVLTFDRIWYGHHTATAETLALAEAYFADVRGTT